MTPALLPLAGQAAAVPREHRPAHAPGSRGQVPLAADGHEAPIAPALPTAFEGFRTLYEPCYLGYAQLHLPAQDACAAVAHTWGHLLTHWPRVVSSPSPTAYAWQQLASFTASRISPLSLAADSPDQYDAVLLHHALGYPLKIVAAATGLHPATVAYLTASWQPDRPL
ncbi:hypothetical protein [Streptomyces sp. NPDC048436]|uniref:hypothetical protein n=1 Tax=Streptomyces sp. NPDC048436 TaxID=3365550 RepID=UPI003720EB0A